MMKTPITPTASRAVFTTSVREPIAPSARPESISTAAPVARMPAIATEPIKTTVSTLNTVLASSGSSVPTLSAR